LPIERRRLYWIGGLVALVTVAYLNSDDNDSQDRIDSQEREQREDPEPPPYEATIRSRTAIDVLTDATDPAELRLVFDEVREQRSDGDWYEVTISCASIPESTGTDTALATGTFANTVRGLETTGLDDVEDVDFETTGRQSCEPVAPTTPGAVTADDVFEALEAADLRVINPRDTSSTCAELDCLSRTTTDQFQVIVWPDEEAAERWAANVTLDVVELGPVTTLQWTDAGFDPEGPERAQYEQAIEDRWPEAYTSTDADGDGRPSS
jgi:hypothetical protein